MIIKSSSYLFILLTLLFFIFIRAFLWMWVDLDLSFDEAQYYNWSQNLDWGYYSKPPMLAWIIKLATVFCGNSEMCIRFPSIIMHTMTALFIGLSAYNFSLKRNISVLFLGIFIWLLIPGVSLSTGFISTDVPLLFFASLIIFFISLILTKNNQKNINIYMILIGCIFALGFLSKYAIIYLFLATLISFFSDKSIRLEFKYYINYKILCLLLLSFFLLITPHIIWNFENGFITAQHTMANANLSAEWNGINNFLKFFFEQFFVFGVITFSLLLFFLYKYNSFSYIERYLVYLTFTPIIIILFQALLSRAHANWAVIAYVPGTILISMYFVKTSHMLGRTLFYINIFTGLILMILIPLSGYYDFGVDPYKKNRGWSNLGMSITEIYKKYPDSVLVTDDRRVLAEALYYMSIKPKTYLRWNADGIIHDHYELTTKHDILIDRTGIMVSSETDNIHFKSSFKEVTFLKEINRTKGINKIKHYKVWLLEGYRKE